MENLSPQTQRQIRKFNDRNAHKINDSEIHLTRRGKVAALAGVALAAGGIFFASKVTASGPESTHAYYSTVQPGSNIIQTAQHLEDENGLDFNATEVGQAANFDLDGKPAHAGDTLVVYTNQDGDVVNQEVITVAEKNSNK